MTDRLNIKVNPKKHKELKILAAERDTSINELVNEAIEDLLEKYGKGGVN